MSKVCILFYFLTTPYIVSHSKRHRQLLFEQIVKEIFTF